MLKTFFNPKSIAVIGASADSKKIGRQILDNIKLGKFKGKIFPINLKEKKIAGLKAYKDIEDVKEAVDLVLIAIPAKFVLAEIEKCVSANIKNIIVISAGFSEDGAEGKQVENKIKEIARKNKINILGPNCLGILSSDANLNASFAKANIINGNIAFVSQSGAIGSAVLDWIENRNIGLSHFISLGNKAVLDENDFFEHFKDDKSVDLVVAYLEEIKDGKRFMQVASDLSKTKPVVILKSGKTESGSQAALSHTGSMAGSQKAIEAGLKRAGVIDVDSMEELFNLMSLFQKQIKISDSDLFVVSNAGGPMVISLDIMEQEGLALGKLTDKTKSALAKKLPELNQIKNPLDVLGDAGVDRYEHALETMLKDKNINNILVLLTPQTSTDIDGTAKLIVSLQKKYQRKFICANFIGGKSLINAKDIFKKGGVINFDYPVQAIKTLAKFIGNQKSLKNNKVYKNKQVKNLASSDKNNQARQMDFLQSLKLLKKYGISSVKTTLIDEDAKLNNIVYPTALKVTGANIIHKTDKHCVALNIADKKEAKQAIASFSLLKNKENYCIAQKMVKNSFEMILGFKRDESFGPIIMVGLGGIYAEAFQDVRVEVDDVDYKRALKMIEELRIYSILSGMRGKASYATDKIAEAIVALAKLARKNPEIKELDINPLFVKRTNVRAGDVRIIV